MWDYLENAAFHWILRDRSTHISNVNLSRLTSIDEQVEADIDGFRIAAVKRGTSFAEGKLADVETGSLFALTALAVSTDRMPLFELAIGYAVQSAIEDKPATCVECLRELTSGMAWVGNSTAVAAFIDEILRSSQPLHRSVGLAVLGARRTRGNIDFAPCFSDLPCVRARAYRTTGQLGRVDLMAHLRPGLTDPDPECRFWSTWAAARMGAGDEALRVLADIAWNNLPRADRALDLLLRRLDLPRPTPGCANSPKSPAASAR